MADAAFFGSPAACAATGPALADPAPRVLYAIVLTPGQKFGSSEDQLCMIAAALKAQGGDCAAFFSTSALNASMHDFTSRGIASACADLSKFSWANLKQLMRFIDEHRIEAVHWNMFSPLRNPYLWALKARRPKVKHLYTDHISRFAPTFKSDYFPQAGVNRHLLGHKLAPKFWTVAYAGVHCISDFVKAELVGRTGIPHAETLLHFVNTPSFARDEAARSSTREALKLGNSLTLLFMGLLLTEKGGHIAIKALARLKGDVTLLIGGTGPEEAKWRALAAELGVADKVRFLGLVRSPRTYFNAADILVAPAIWLEAAGFVNIEGQAAGLPVVASRIGGIPEYVVDGETGLLFEPGNDGEMAAHLQRLVDDAGLRGRMAQRALEHARANFSPERGTSDMIAWYRQCLGTAAHRQPAKVHPRAAAI